MTKRETHTPSRPRSEPRTPAGHFNEQGRDGDKDRK